MSAYLSLASLFVALILVGSWFQRRIRIAKAVKLIRARMESTFQEAHEFVPVQATEFPSESLAFYDTARDEAQALGFALLADVEDRTLSRSNPAIRTFVRLMVHPDGAIRFSAFAVPVPPASDGTSRGGPICVCEFISELSDGSELTTTTAPKARLLDPSPQILRHHEAPGTPVARLFDAHLARLSAQRGAHPDIAIEPVQTLEQSLAAWQRGYDRRRKRLSDTGLTEAELLRMGGPGHEQAARAVFRELQKERARKRG